MWSVFEIRKPKRNMIYDIAVCLNYRASTLLAYRDAAQSTTPLWVCVLERKCRRTWVINPHRLRSSDASPSPCASRAGSRGRTLAGNARTEAAPCYHEASCTQHTALNEGSDEITLLGTAQTGVAKPGRPEECFANQANAATCQQATRASEVVNEKECE